jgi:hypothetical protein
MKQNYSITLSVKNKLVLVFLALLGVILVFLSTSRYGAGLSFDSVGYIGIARNLITGSGFTFYDGRPLISQPPLFPTLLAIAGGLFKTDPLALANIVNALIFGLIVYFGGELTFKYLSSFPTFAIIGSSAILASIPLFTVSVMAWSEPLFILLVILSLLFANLYLEKNDVISLILLSLSVALSSLTRYIGVVLILWGAFIIVVFYRNSLKNKITHLSLYTCISALPIGLWLIRNYVISNTLFGSRAPSAYTLFQNLKFVFDDLMTWYIPGIIANHRLTLILFGMIIGFSVGFNLKESLQSVKLKLRQIIPIVLFIVIYTAFLVISSTTTAYDAIGDRLLSPIYVPLTLLFLILAQALVGSYRGRFSNKIGDSFLIIVVAIWLLAYPIHNILVKAVELAPIGQGYSSKSWIESQTVQYLLQHQTLQSECTIYTNGPDAAYILAHLATKTSPSRREYNFQGATNENSRLANVWLIENNKACLVWFDKINRNDLFTFAELRSVANINLIARFDDGAIYSVMQK